MITLVGNLKGGTGKSTVAFNLALWLLDHNQRVELCDLDPQATLRDAADVRSEFEYQPALPVAGRIPRDSSGHVLVDVGLSDQAAMHRAIARADRILIPVAPSQADVWATQQFVDIIADVAPKDRKPETMAFINRADTHPGSRENDEAAEALRQLEDVTVLKPRLSQRMAFRRSFSEGLAVFEMEPRGKAAAELMTLAQVVFRGKLRRA
ncbi:MAG: AAA family ATPase [Hyphomicrobiales bacterium]|nr:AAA family ATPase [Hyphomicrobiales bacterium]